MFKKTLTNLAFVAMLGSISACESFQKKDDAFSESEKIDKKFFDNLKEGDVVIRRSDSFDSAAMAKISGGEFSHCTLIDILENGDLTFLEMNGNGLKRVNLGDYLEGARNNGTTRLTVLRFKDAKIAKNTTEISSRKIGKIKFDYGWDLTNSEKMYCCQLVKFAFDSAAKKFGKNVSIPFSLSKLNDGLYNAPLIKLAGLETKTLVAPDDFLNDPHFIKVRRWKKTSRETEYYNAVYEKIYGWINGEGYRHIDGKSISLLAHSIKFFRDNFSLISDITGLSSEIYKDTPVGLIETGLRQRELSNILLNRLKKIENSQSPMTHEQMLKFLEELRLRDIENYGKYLEEIETESNPREYRDRPIFHHLFRPAT